MSAFKPLLQVAHRLIENYLVIEADTGHSQAK